MIKVFRPGVFDLLHVGHINCIKDAAKQGDHLIIGVHDDRDVLKDKGKSPVIPLEQRMLLLNEIKCVNEVISYRTHDLTRILKKLNINVLAVNDQYGTSSYNNYEEQKKTIDFCKKNKIRIHRSEQTKFISSTQIKKNIEFWNNLSTNENINATMLTSFNKNKKLQSKQTKKEIEIFKKYFKKNMRTLDIGCGNGRLSIPLSKHCKKMICVDSSKHLIENFPKKTNTELIVQDALDFVKNKSNTKFDAIIMSGLLQNFDDFEFNEFFKHMEKLTHKNTLLLIRVSIGNIQRINVINQFSDALDSLYTAYYRTIEEIDDKLKKYKKVEEVSLYANHEDTKTIFIAYKKKS